MKICLLTPKFFPDIGGAEIVIDALASAFAEKGHEPVVMAPEPAHDLDIDYRVRWYKRPRSWRWFPERVTRQYEIAQQDEKFDIVLCFYAHPTGFAAVRWGKRTGVPVVMISQGGDLYREGVDRNRPHVWRRVADCYKEADAVVAISEYMAELVREVAPNPKRLVSIPNGIKIADIQEPSTRPSDFDEQRPFALCLGNLGRWKGFDTAIDAMAKGKDKLGDLALVIVGNGPLESQLRNQIEQHGIQDRVLMVGQRLSNDKRWFLQNCEFGVMPSTEEGMPIVGLELLACGKPNICSTNSAFNTLYEDGVNSFRVPARDPDRLADAMARMREADLSAMGKVSAERARQFDWPVVADQYLQLCEEMIAERA